MANITLDIPDDVLVRIRNGGNEPSEALRLAAAFSLCRQGELSASQAARLAGLVYADFIEAAARAKIDLFPVNIAELKEEASDGYTLGRQRVAGHSAGPRGTT